MTRIYLILATTCLSLVSVRARAQDNNPLINSGDTIRAAANLYDTGNYSAALKKLETVNESDTNYVMALYEKALTCAADSQYAHGMEYCREALALPTQRELAPKLYGILTTLYDQAGQPDKALSIADSALAQFPAAIQLYVNKGGVLYRGKRYPEAEEVFRKALLINPYISVLHYNLGVTALKEGNPVGAFLSLTAYLLMDNEGSYSKNAIALLSDISLAKENITVDIDKRSKEPAESLRAIEEIVLSKIALEKDYKPLIRIDDAISRQMQVIFEKLSVQPGDKDFWIQYYGPFYQQAFADKKFELLVNYAFGGVDLPMIKQFNKDKKKDIQRFVEDMVVYFNLIRKTRELDPGKRQLVTTGYYFDDGNLSSRGTVNGQKLTGPWEFYFPGGNLKSRGAFTDKGEKTGTWNYYYNNGSLNGEERYVEGKEEGEEVYYFSNGVVSARSNYRNGKLDGKKTTYYRGGAVKSIQEYRAGKLDGAVRNFYASGMIRSLANYKEDQYDGNFVTYFENGNVEKKGNYANGLLSGPYVLYHSNGSLSQEAQYTKDNIDGLVKNYFRNGKLKVSEHYANGKQDGEYAEYYDNGQLFYHYVSKNGRYDGDIEFHDTDGIKFGINSFSGDKLVGGRYFDKNGKQISASSAKDGQWEFHAYTPDGYREAITLFDQDGMKNGNKQIFYASGKLSETDTYQHNELNGKAVGYSRSGQPSFSQQYDNGKRNGYSIAFNENGTRKREGWTVNEEAQGTWLYRDEQGNLTTKSNFLGDELNGIQTEYWPDGRLKFRNRYDRGQLTEVTQFDTLGKTLSSVKLVNGNGVYKLLHFNGRTKTEGTYRNGRLDGVLKTFYFDGKIESVLYYKHGLLDSVYKAYHYNGQVATEGQYARDEKTGTWTSYLETGSRYSTKQYDHGELQGKTVYFFPNGKPDTEISFEEDEREGNYTKYTEEGAILYRLNFRNGTPVSFTFTDSTSTLLTPQTIRGGAAKIIAYYANGKKSAEFEYVDGKVNGPDNLYYPNGKPRLISSEAFGSTEGSLNSYYANGHPKTQYHYRFDNADGPYTEYNESGMLKEQGIFYNGVQHGLVTKYDDKGKPAEHQIFYYGQLLNAYK